MKFIVMIIINAIILHLMSIIFPHSLSFDNFTTTILASFIISICSALTYRTLLGVLFVSIPLLLSAILGSLGLMFMLFAISTLFLYVADWILNGMTIGGFWWGMLVVFFLSIVNVVLYPTKNSNG